MTEFWFPDTTVFRTFAAGERLDLLESFLSGNGRWTKVIEVEVRNTEALLPDLSIVPTWFPTSAGPRDQAESLEIENFRVNQMAGDPLIPREHAGESETYVIIRNRPELRGSTFLTDDRDAYDLFPPVVPTMHSLEILKVLVARYELTAQEAFEFVTSCEALERHFLDFCPNEHYFDF